MLTAPRIGTLSVGAAAAAALVLLAPHAPEAHAAGGTFSYIATDGKGRTSANPPSQMCIKVTGTGLVKNMTDEDVTLYKTPDCADANKLTTLGAKKSQTTAVAFRSLMWDDPNDSDSDSDDSGSQD